MESERYHQLSKNHSAGKRLPNLPESAWPAAWRTTYYKEYGRLRKVPLSNGQLPPADLGGTILARASGRDMGAQPLSLAEIGWPLKYSCGLIERDDSDARKHRVQPSAGARYPIETYLLNIVAGELAPGTFHYDVKNNSLDVLEERPFSETELRNLFTYEWVGRASAVVVMTAVFLRNQDKYGERGYRYILFEAGHIAQNLALIATSLGIQNCPMAGMRDSLQEENLDIDGITESVLYSIVLGK